ncbi:MAG: hypothetical protein R6V12_01455 [Candidatus Hydrogenedentota bacterium]
MEDKTTLETRLAHEAEIEPGLDPIDRHARLVARTWYSGSEFDSSLVYRGINLGRPLEQVLVYDLIPIFARSREREEA